MTEWVAATLGPDSSDGLLHSETNGNGRSTLEDKLCVIQFHHKVHFACKICIYLMYSDDLFNKTFVL